MIWRRYDTFESDLPPLCKELRLKTNELVYNDYVLLVAKWLKINDQAG